MSILNDYKKMSRKPRTYAILLNLPYISYAFILLQIRGGYVLIQNFYSHHKQLPSMINILFITIRYSLIASFSFIAINSLFLYLGLNYFGQSISSFLIYFSKYFEAMFTLPMTTYIFGTLCDFFQSKDITLNLIKLNAVTILISFPIFSICGAFLSISNIKTDIQRNQPTL